jgi:hypothetical protein
MGIQDRKERLRPEGFLGGGAFCADLAAPWIIRL